MKIKSEIVITPTSVVLNCQTIEVQATGDAMLVALYRQFVGNYPKFFKMDTLSRLGFIAAEMLLQHDHADAVILANRSASITNDRKYLETISEGNYFPSPALFVYTLPNIVTGEIAIRHQIYGETSFYILESHEQLEQILRSTFKHSNLQTILSGWCECNEPDHFYAKMQILYGTTD